jgi:D-3-phosphoglycerate dehydrogenase / 2-oxoglutarate reductase
VLTPHLAGGTYQSARAMSDAAIAEVLRVLRGERPLHAVNPEAFGA